MYGWSIQLSSVIGRCCCCYLPNSLFHFSIVIPRYCFFFQSPMLLFHFSNAANHQKERWHPFWDSTSRPPDLIHDTLDHRTTVSCIVLVFIELCVLVSQKVFPTFRDTDLEQFGLIDRTEKSLQQTIKES